MNPTAFHSRISNTPKLGQSSGLSGLSRMTNQRATDDDHDNDIAALMVGCAIVTNVNAMERHIPKKKQRINIRGST